MQGEDTRSGEVTTRHEEMNDLPILTDLQDADPSPHPDAVPIRIATGTLVLSLLLQGASFLGLTLGQAGWDTFRGVVILCSLSMLFLGLIGFFVSRFGHRVGHRRRCLLLAYANLGATLSPFFFWPVVDRLLG